MTCFLWFYVSTHGHTHQQSTFNPEQQKLSVENDIALSSIIMCLEIDSSYWPILFNVPLTVILQSL